MSRNCAALVVNLQIGLIGLLWLVGASALALFASIWQRGHVGRRPWLALLPIASALYAFGYGLELAGDSVAWVFATFRIQHLAIALSPTIVLWMASDLGEFRRATRRAAVGLSSLVSVATIAIVYTEQRHDWYHVDLRMDTSGPFPLIAFDAGPWYVGFHVYVALALLTANVVLLRTWLRARPGSPRRGQAAMVALASLLPWLGSLVYLSGLLPLSIDLTPITLAFTSFFIYRGVTRHALADVSPIARDLVFERMLDPVLVLDVEGRVVDHNEAAVLLVSGGRHAWLGRTPQDVLGHDLVPITAASTPHDTVVDSEQLQIAGRTYDTRLAHLRDPRGRPLGQAVVLRDVTDHAQARATLARLASTDELTSISNRRHFIDLTERVMERGHRDGRPTSLVIFDLDSFKLVNDTHGHQAGDALLRAIAAAVAANLRPTDVLGRYGGEEFAVCLPDTGAGDALAAAERLRATVAATTITRNTKTVGVNASVGVSTTDPRRDVDLETLLHHADGAQYLAKRRGGNQVVAHGSEASVDVGVSR